MARITDIETALYDVRILARLLDHRLADVCSNDIRPGLGTVLTEAEAEEAQFLAIELARRTEAMVAQFEGTCEAIRKAKAEAA